LNPCDPSAQTLPNQSAAGCTIGSDRARFDAEDRQARRSSRPNEVARHKASRTFIGSFGGSVSRRSSVLQKLAVRPTTG